MKRSSEFVRYEVYSNVPNRKCETFSAFLMELNTYFCHIYKAIKRSKIFLIFLPILNCVSSRANSYFYKTQYFPICIR